ncbi:LicD family-domain-containing protein [Cladorrhinum sp. PSN332]|nr:LicD family-domain-containing protein [Cladorrhinum sp. PSN332]
MRLGISFLLRASLCLSAAAVPSRSPSLVVQNEKEFEHTASRTEVTPERYFHESEFHARYDSRFAEKQLDYEEQKWSLKNLTHYYLATLTSIGIETWLMHNTLLGWWWEKQILPWEPTLDVQILEAGVFFLATYHNMSVHQFRIPGTRERRHYLLDISPSYNVRERTDKSDTADARWIDMQTGLFIDIHAVRYNLSHPGGEGMLSCKDGSELKDTSLFPLRDTTFEGVPAKIPYRYRELLAAEYGVDALIKGDRENHLYDDDQSEWVRTRNIDL